MGLVLSNSNFFINKNSQGRKSVREKSTYSLKFGFSNILSVSLTHSHRVNEKKISSFSRGLDAIFTAEKIGCSVFQVQIFRAIATKADPCTGCRNRYYLINYKWQL